MWVPYPPRFEAVTKLNNFVTYGGRSPGEAQYVVVSKEEFEFCNSLKSRRVGHPLYGLVNEKQKTRAEHPASELPAVPQPCS